MNRRTEFFFRASYWEAMSITPKQIFSNLDLIISGFFLCITVLVVIVNVVLRYAFQGGIYWAEEVATTSFIWSVFVGSAAAYRYKMHIGIDFVTRIGPMRLRAFITVLIDLMMLAINGYIVYLSILFTLANRLKRTPVLDIPAMYVNLGLTAGFTLMSVYAFVYFCQDLRKLINLK